MRLPHVFNYDSSPVDWCEPNYVVSPYIAEFFNTISSIPICIVGIVHMEKYRPFVQHYDRKLQLLFYLVVGVGIGSTLFHSTLSIAGQLADELFILWFTSLLTAWYWPKQALPANGSIRRYHLRNVYLTIAAVSTLLCHLHPFINHFALVVLALPLLIATSYAYFNTHLNNASTPIASYIYLSAAFTGVAATSAWVIDIVLCPATQKINFPYFHAIWHILSAIGICNCFNLCVFYELQSSTKFGKNVPIKLKKYPSFLGYFAYQCLCIEVE